MPSSRRPVSLHIFSPGHPCERLHAHGTNVVSRHNSVAETTAQTRLTFLKQLADGSSGIPAIVDTECTGADGETGRRSSMEPPKINDRLAAPRKVDCASRRVSCVSCVASRMRRSGNARSGGAGLLAGQKTETFFWTGPWILRGTTSVLVRTARVCMSMRREKEHDQRSEETKKQRQPKPARSRGTQQRQQQCRLHGLSAQTLRTGQATLSKELTR